jgi:hypothetical protein
MRIIHENEDLRGVAIRNPGSFLYVGGCIQGEKGGKLTTYIGDCTAADYINNTGPADWSQADTYASYWRGNINMEGSKIPLNIGYLHHDPVAEVARQGIAKVTNSVEVAILKGLPSFTLGNYSFHSWSTCWEEYASKIPGATKELFISAITAAFTGYPSLESRTKNLARDLLSGKLEPLKSMPAIRDVEFFDGVKVSVDSDNLPALPRLNDRYELARKIEADADALNAEPHYVFVHTIDPPIIAPLRDPDDWLQRKAGF